jgi:hypothetical protein
LNQARQQVQWRLTRWGFAEACEDTLYGCVRSNFTLLLSADSVRQREQPAILAGLLRRLRDYVSEVVLIVLADSSAIGKLREFYFQHRIQCRRGRPDSGTNTALGNIKVRAPSSWSKTGLARPASLSDSHLTAVPEL